MSKNSSSNEESSPTPLRTVGVTHIPGSQYYEQGIKGGRSGSSFKNGAMRHCNGNGGASVVSPSDLVLDFVNKDNVEVPVSIKQDFVEGGFSRITKKRLEAIESTMPQEITLENRGGRIAVNSDQMNEWIENAKQKAR